MAGLFSYVHTALGNIACAVEKGYIRVVDMKSSPNTYLEPFQVGEKNAWELYFKQPLNYSLEDVYKCGKYIISPEVPARYPGSRGALGMKNKEECDFWSILMIKNSTSVFEANAVKRLRCAKGKTKEKGLSFP